MSLGEERLKMGMGTKILVELDGDLQGLNLKVKGGVCY